MPLPTAGQEKFSYNISITISKIINIDEIDGKFSIKMTMNRTWINPQLTYMNLHKSKDLNILTKEDKHLMWIPHVVFHNMQSHDSKKRTDKLDTLQIIPNSEFSYRKSDKNQHKNARIFEGSENKINQEKEYSVDFMCDFHFAWYPFDTQICSLMFYGNDKLAEVVPTTVHYLGPPHLSQHNFKSVSICSHNIQNRSGIIVEVFLGRPLFGSILNTFMPTIILVVLSQMIGMFKSQEHIEMVIGVHLTILLVLATM